MDVSLPKLKAILCYFGENTNPAFLGKVKLMKLFYFLDFLHVKKYGAPVTYDKYVHLEHGPIPTTIKNLVDTVYDDIDNAVLADTIKFEKSDEFAIHRITFLKPLTEEDKKYFSHIELETIERVCQRFGDKNTKFIKDASHKEAPWTKTSLLEDIPYTLATQDGDCQIEKEEIEMMLNI